MRAPYQRAAGLRGSGAGQAPIGRQSITIYEVTDAVISSSGAVPATAGRGFGASTSPAMSSINMASRSRPPPSRSSAESY